MKTSILWILFFSLTTSIFAQPNTDYSKIDKLALQIPDASTQSAQTIADYINLNFLNDSDKLRAIFAWISGNIKYDVKNMYAVNFYESTNEIIDKVLKTRKGICMGYAALFVDLSTKTGIKSYMIAGYTKQNGKVDYISHAWCAAKIDSVWMLFDPTWGSGFIQKSKFVRQINNSFYKAMPDELIKTHMPFDPLWQFLNYPVTNQEFYESQFQLNNNKPFFNYNDTLAMYEAQSPIEKLISSSARIKMNGVKNSMIADMLKHNTLEIENYNHNQMVGKYNLAVNAYNNGIIELNRFIEYRNQQFTPEIPDHEIKEILDKTEHLLKEARNYLEEVINNDKETKTNMRPLKKSTDEAMNKLDEQRIFLNKYIKTSKWDRKKLFYK